MRFSILAVVLITSITLRAQQFEQMISRGAGELPQWAQLMYAPDPDPGAVQAAYTAYYATHPFVKNMHTQFFKRWKREIGHAIVPKDPAQREDYEENLGAYLAASSSTDGDRAANWTCIGPFDWDHGAVDKSYAAGAAHVYTVEQSASNGNLIYAGTANAGVWKSTDKGLNWTNMTKGMMIGTVYSVEIDHTVENTVYFGAENKLYKSTNGGSTWSIVGDATFNSVNHSIRDLVMHPTNNQVLFLCSNQGLYRSANGGTTFTQVQTGNWQELEFKPGTATTVYAVKQTGVITQFWRSLDTGVTFSQMTTGWPVPVAPDEQERTEIAVTADAPNTVYALCTGVANGGSGLYGVYKSTDSGASWTFQCCGPSPGGVPSPTNFNLMGWDDGGQDDGGQYYYDLAFAVDPANANKLQVCGVQRWVSTDGGVTFTCPAKWSHSNKVDYVHADIHDMRYYGSEIWLANDGGIFYSSDAGATFNRRMFGIAGTDFWGFGAGGWTGSNVMLGGTYHNGTLLKDNDVYTNGWVCTDGGDGIRGFVHPQYDRRALSDYGYKTLSGDRTVSNGNTGWGKQPNASYITGESSEVVWHPNLVNTAFVGNGNSIWRTDDNGAGFVEVYNFGEKVTSIEVSFSDPNTMYACTYIDWWGLKKVWRSTNGGTNWTEITPSSATINGNTWIPYDIAVSATDPQTLWLVRTSQYGDYPNINGYVIYKSVNGGANWTNITDASLNNEWPTNIAHQLGTNGGLYIGTRRAVYYRSDAAPTWTLWNAGLPARIFSTRLLINYRDQKIRNGTDRSVWESNLETSSSPVANFCADKRTITCLAPSVQFYDNSVLSGNGYSWSWSFPGGTPSTSTNRSPLITYNAPGTYDVTLTVTDANGTNARTIAGFVTYANFTATAPMLADAEDQAVTPTGWRIDNPDGLDTWTNEAVTGADGNATRAWRMDYYYYNAPGQVDRLITPVITLGGSAGTHLKFHHAYKPYGASYPDGLRVEISTNCGQNWTQLYYAQQAALGTTSTGTSPWAPTAANQWLLHDIDISAYDGQSVVIRFTGVNGYGDRLYLDNLEVVNNGLRLALKLFLDGPFDPNTLLMRDDLRVAGLVPNGEPYTALGFAQASDGGGEVMQAGVSSRSGNDAIVDWVQVELRDASTPTIIIATRPALVQRDGDVVAEDGISPIALLAPAGSYKIAVRHRNHLGAMTASSVPLSSTIVPVDFTDQSLALYGTEPTRIVGTKRALWSGNTLRDVELKYTGATNDRDPILVAIGGSVPTNTVAGYRMEDVNLDGVTKYTGSFNDRDPILVNIGGSIPTAVRTQQLP
ncbi:MAG: PKD domain-containing protein [Flavobacteriales bacterium]|nr:PKD domain-containing protein [Flavobacteriales bacterium]MCC6939049.1 PKD domain-containing protein [Flavobacteriales bacterium]